MQKKNAFNQFAPAILRVYHREKEAFWRAVMAPFLLENVSLLVWLKHLKVDFGLLSAFIGLDDEARPVEILTAQTLITEYETFEI